MHVCLLGSFCHPLKRVKFFSYLFNLHPRALTFVKLVFVQALPCTKAHIDANPNLKEDHTMGVLAGEFPVNYESFDDVVASGKKHINMQP